VSLCEYQIAFFAFVGLEVVGTAAAETHNPERNLPKAINAIPVRLALVYVLGLALATVPLTLLVTLAAWLS